MKKKARSLVLNWRVGFCFPPFEGGQGGCCFNLGGGKDVAVFKNDETVSAGIEKNPNGRGGVVVVSHSPQTDFRRAVQSTKTDSGLHCGFLQFVCVVVIELDGSPHYEPDALAYDFERTKVLESLGLKVIRFDNSAVFENLNGVVSVILREVEMRV